ncbi:hypothetical protein [Pseudomonas sp. GL-R-26]|uniref:hypothetical protein n=1 Tax=Pseudomonas sp. GL-R-26 TaxID=2832392 RepID=UPI001CBE3B96|nr:hypothetical protein [Pseudomonas sp. GL-R-26]
MQDEMRAISDKWYAANKPAENFIYNADVEAMEFHSNGIEPHLLDQDGLICFGVESTKKLLFGNLGSIHTKDIDLFWSWMLALLLDCQPTPPPHPIRDNTELYQLLETCAALAISNEETNIMNPRSNDGVALSYLCFPLMEALSRTILSEYLRIDGTVIKDFTVFGSEYGEKKRYKYCSSLKDSLHFAIEQIKNPTLQEGLSDLITNLEKFSEADVTGYKYLYGLRNSALHAGKSPPTIGGYCFSISLLLALYVIEEKYDGYSKWAKTNISNFKKYPRPCFYWQGHYAKLYLIEGKGNEFV